MKIIYPQLTVLMPVYNAEKFLDESINSILSQTYSDFELLILDDASTDNSLKIIKNYAKKDKRIKVLTNKTNQKQAKCRNRLLKNSKTEFIAWMDADDISLPVRLQTQIDFLEKNPSIDVVSSRVSFFGDKSHLRREFLFNSQEFLLDHQIKSDFLFNSAVVGGCSMVKMEKIIPHKIFYNEKLIASEDYQYWIDCCPFICFANIDTILYNYRRHPFQNTADQKRLKKINSVIIKNHLSKFGIKIDKKTEYIFWGCEKLNKKNVKKISKFASKVLSIKNFYGYPGVNKKIIFNVFCQYMKPHWMQSVTEYSLNLASIPLNQLCFSKLSVLDYFRVFLIKITRRLFYIKKFGVRNYSRVLFQ